MKRFTETEKWRDPWFRKLPPHIKCLWQYLCDTCCPAGTFDIDWALVSFVIGKKMDVGDVNRFEGRLVKLSNGRFLIIQFIEFQYGVLSKDCRPHDRVFKAIQQNQIPYPYPKPSVSTRVGTTLEEGKEEEEEDRKGDARGNFPEVKDSHHKDSRTALLWLNDKAGVHYRETDTNLGIISARLSEPGVTLASVLAMIDRQVKQWKGTNMADYLRPETLFGKRKFDSYYAQREQPIIAGHHRANVPENPRNAGIIKGPTDYAAAFKRKAESGQQAPLAGHISENKNESPATGGVGEQNL